MVSFSCEACGDILTKKKLDPHRNRCRGATFTCIDCMVHFPGFEYRSHTSCMTEDQKYQGALYKPKKPQQRPAQPSQDMNTLALQPFVEDIDEPRPEIAEILPEAPTPPSAAHDDDDNVNVFDFLVAAGQTPSASRLSLSRDKKVSAAAESTALVRHEPKADESKGPEPTTAKRDGKPPAQPELATPAPKGERRRSRSKDGEGKKDKKRKRLHVDPPADQVMTDAPPVLHSGLTGGLKSLMRLPPSPDLSGDNAADAFSASPLKKTKHSKHHNHHHHHHHKGSTQPAATGIFGMIAGGPTKTKTKKQKTSKKHSHHHKEKKQKLIDYASDAKEDEEHQMVVFKPQADVFLSFVNKGPESEKGCSMNKALKRFHRERQASGGGKAKGKDEKELWRSLRLRRNDRGEIVLFTV